MSVEQRKLEQRRSRRASTASERGMRGLVAAATCSVFPSMGAGCVSLKADDVIRLDDDAGAYVAAADAAADLVRDATTPPSVDAARPVISSLDAGATIDAAAPDATIDAAPDVVGEEEANAAVDADLPPPFDASVEAASLDAGPEAELAPEGGTTLAPEAGTTISTGCDPGAPFTDVEPVQGLLNPQMLIPALSGATFSPDERTIWFSLGGGIWTATRQTANDVFGSAQMLVSFTGFDFDPSITSDEDTLLFADLQENLLHLATRSNPTAAFEGGAEIPNLVPSAMMTGSPFVMLDGSAIYFPLLFGNNAVGFARIYVSRRLSSMAAAPFAPAVAVGGLDPGNTNLTDTAPVVSADGLTIYWGRIDSSSIPLVSVVMRAQRSTPADDFGAIEPIAELNGLGGFLPRWLSPDGCRLYMENDGYWVASKNP